MTCTTLSMGLDPDLVAQLKTWSSTRRLRPNTGHSDLEEHPSSQPSGQVDGFEPPPETFAPSLTMVDLFRQALHNAAQSDQIDVDLVSEETLSMLSVIAVGCAASTSPTNLAPHGPEPVPQAHPACRGLHPDPGRPEFRRRWRQRDLNRNPLDLSSGWWTTTDWLGTSRISSGIHGETSRSTSEWNGVARDRCRL